MSQDNRKISEQGPLTLGWRLMFVGMIGGMLGWVIFVPKSDQGVDFVLPVLFFVLMQIFGLRDYWGIYDAYEAEGGLIFKKLNEPEVRVLWCDVVRVRRARKTLRQKLFVDVKTEGGDIEVYPFLPKGHLFQFPEAVANFKAKLEPLEYVSFCLGKQSTGDSSKT